MPAHNDRDFSRSIRRSRFEYVYQNHIVPMQIEIVERYNLPIIPIHDLTKGFNETDYMDGLIPMILATRELLKKLNMLLRMC